MELRLPHHHQHHLNLPLPFSILDLCPPSGISEGKDRRWPEAEEIEATEDKTPLRPEPDLSGKKRLDRFEAITSMNWFVNVADLVELESRRGVLSFDALETRR